MFDVKIEKAGKTDVEDIAKIAYQVADLHDKSAPEYFRPVSKEEQLQNIKNMLVDERVIVFKAVCENKVCGFLFLEMIHRASVGLVYSKLGNILNLGVDEPYQRRGIGTTLIKAAEKYVHEQGGEALDMDVFYFNKEAIKLYERLGYKITDVSMRKVLE